MFKKIIKNDIKSSKIITFTVMTFVLLSGLFTSIATSLTVNLGDAVDEMMEKGKTPHLLHMHTGDLDFQRMEKFVKDSDLVDEYQILEMINIEGGAIEIGESTLENSIQDNGFVTQSESFDYLFDLNGDLIEAELGEIYIPIYYMKTAEVKKGDKVKIGDLDFKVKGFVRDSQMNSPLSSSKRFVVSEKDQEKLKTLGSLEYLIEFRFIDKKYINDFEAAYLSNGLEANGPPAITYPLFKIINSINDGIMIGILLLISLLIILITFMCIRFSLMTKIENDYKEIGTLKALGIRISQIKKLYLVKYLFITGVAAIFGYLISLPAQKYFIKSVALNTGAGEVSLKSLIASSISTVLIFLIIILYVNHILNQFKKISPVQAISFGAPELKAKTTSFLSLKKPRKLSINKALGIKDVILKKKRYSAMFFVVLIATLIITLPNHLYTTISDKSFTQYMGMGNSDLFINFKTEDKDKIEKIYGELKRDSEIEDIALYKNSIYDIKLPNGSIDKLLITSGNHEKFPVKYLKGNSPKNIKEMGISKLKAEDLELEVGEIIEVEIDGKVEKLKISGIYSDITNGGKTGKINLDPKTEPIISSVIQIKFKDGYSKEKIEKFKENYPRLKISDMENFVDQTFGDTVRSIDRVSKISFFIAVTLLILITTLLVKLLIAKDTRDIAILKSLGFSFRELKEQYLSRTIFTAIFAILLGIIISLPLGRLLVKVILSMFGGTSMNIKINRLMTFVVVPLMVISSVYIFTVIGISDIKQIQVSENIKE